MLQLVLARALQGIGGGMLVATAFVCVPALFPESHERLCWQVLFSNADRFAHFEFICLERQRHVGGQSR